ncbi:MAG: hypothetical protein NTW51_01310 [Cyanobacteria bacterium]|nr:hypothetical protein [Cyanobacteriota bacterium]
MSVAEENRGLNPEGRSRLKAKTALTIAIIGWLLIAFSLNALIFNSFPLELATPEWQLNLIASLISASPSLLIGATLIALSLVFDPSTKNLKDWNLIVARAASWFAIVLLLIIPLQFYLGSRVLKSQSNRSYEAINNLKSIAKGISAINSEADLRLYVASLPNAPRLPAKFDAPFPVIKQRAIENIQAQINAGSENIKLQKSEGLQVFLKEAIRNMAQAILMTASFSALAALNSKATNAFTKLFTSLLPKSLR